MSSKRDNALHDGWICFSDILLVLVCSLVFLRVLQQMEDSGGGPAEHTVEERSAQLHSRLNEVESEVNRASKELRAARLIANEIEPMKK